MRAGGVPGTPRRGADAPRAGLWARTGAWAVAASLVVVAPGGASADGPREEPKGAVGTRDVPEAPPAAERSPTVTLRLADEEAWEGAVPADVRAVLGSVIDEFLPYVPGAEPVMIEVRPRGGPISLFERAPDGAVRVNLNTGGNLWSQYAYQFAHELCHVFCRFDRDDTGNQWFEEAVCEIASLFVLRRMATTWREMPPYPNWRDYSGSLETYAARIIDEGRLPEGLSLADWYQRHRDELPTRPTDRDNARAIAAALLPLFEDEPGRWGAIPWLNAARPARPQSFRDYLLDWRRHAPVAQAATIEAIAAAFGVTLPAVEPGEGGDAP
jgi:hypothetical protein